MIKYNYSHTSFFYILLVAFRIYAASFISLGLKNTKKDYKNIRNIVRWRTIMTFVKSVVHTLLDLKVVSSSSSIVFEYFFKYFVFLLETTFSSHKLCSTDLTNVIIVRHRTMLRMFLKSFLVF